MACTPAVFTMRQPFFTEVDMKLQQDLIPVTVVVSMLVIMLCGLAAIALVF
jgi:hypothetical protein